MGGAANSALWMQIKADVTQRKVLVPAADTATALGAALLAGVGTGVYDSFDQAVRRTVRVRRAYRPGAEGREAYERGYAAYRALYENLKDQMREGMT